MSATSPEYPPIRNLVSFPRFYQPFFQRHLGFMKDFVGQSVLNSEKSPRQISTTCFYAFGKSLERKEIAIAGKGTEKKIFQSSLKCSVLQNFVLAKILNFIVNFWKKQGT